MISMDKRDRDNEQRDEDMHLEAILSDREEVKHLLITAVFWSVIAFVVVGAVVVSVNMFITKCSVDGGEFISKWDLPPGNYTCLICADFLTQEQADRQYNQCLENQQNFVESQSLSYPGNVFMQLLGASV